MRLIDADVLKNIHGMKDDCAECDKELRHKSRSCEFDRVYTLMDFCGWIDDAPTIEPEQRWIPVVDKTPKHFQPVLLCTSKKIIEVGYWDVCCDCWCKTSGDSVYFLPGEEVVAWMPLPEPWKEGETDASD